MSEIMKGKSLEKTCGQKIESLIGKTCRHTKSLPFKKIEVESKRWSCGWS